MYIVSMIDPHLAQKKSEGHTAVQPIKHPRNPQRMVCRFTPTINYTSSCHMS